MIATSQFTISVINDGAPGSTGPQGVSVTKVVEEYRLSDSSTELTGSGTGYTWSETKPDIPSGKYLWIRERTDLSNNTSAYGTAHCDIVISGLVFDVNRNSGAITSKIWESDITSSINEYDGSTGKAIRDRVTQTENDISGINTTVGNVQTTLNTKADGSTVTALQNDYSSFKQTMNGFKTTVESSYATIEDLNGVKVSGNNLYHIKNEVPGYLNASSGEIINPSSKYKEKTSAYIPVIPNVTYIIQSWATPTQSDSSWLGYQFFTDETASGKIGNRVSKYGSDSGSGVEITAEGQERLTYKVTAPENAKYLRVSYRHFEDGCCMVEQATIPSEYAIAPVDIEHDTDTKVSQVRTIAEQTADKFTWLVQNGTSASNFTLTSRVAELISPQVVIKDPAGSATIITGGKIQANSITTNMLKSDAIKSTNYTASSNASSPYSATGTFLDLNTGSLYMPNFGVNGTTGAAYFNGTVNANAGKFGNDTSYWNIETVYDYNMQPHAALVGTGSPYLQTGNWQVSDNAVATRKYTSTSESAGNATYYKDASSNTFYDVGMKIPTNFGGYSASDSSVTRYNKAFYYGRKYTGNNIPSLDSDWTYFFEIDSGGNVITAGDVYEGGVKLSEKYAAITDVGSAYLPKTGGTITGNLTVNGNFTTNLMIQTNLASTSAAQLTGNANATVTHGVTGTLGVGNGGTGKTTAHDAANAFITALPTWTAIPTDDTYFIRRDTGGGAIYGQVKFSTLWTYINNKITSTYDIANTYRRIDDNQFDTIDITDAQVGNLIVTGAGRFTNGLYGDLTGNVVGNVSGSAGSVANNLKIQLNGGTTEGTNQFTYNGSATKNINITKSSIGLGNVDNTADADKSVNYAISAGSATKDSSGNTIASTYVKKTGDTFTGSLMLKATNVDASKANNNVSQVNYPTMFNIVDNGDRILSRQEAIIYDNGNIGAYWYVRNYNTSGTQVGQKGIQFIMDKTGALTYSVSDSDKFRAAIGLGSVNNTADANKAVASAGKLTNSRSFTIGNTAKNVDWSGAVSFSKEEISDNASTSAAGWMSQADKSKLDSITVTSGGTIEANNVVGTNGISVTLDKTTGIATVKHANSAITAGTASGTATSTLTNGGNFNIPTVTYDAYGHITAKGTTTLTLPNITSVTGNAGTATKFASAQSVTLTGDTTGTASSQAGWSLATTTNAVSATELTNQNLNDYHTAQKTHFYFAAGGNTVTNKPFTTDSGFGVITYGIAGGFVAQEVTQGVAKWVRYYNNSTWSNWFENLTTNNYTSYTVKKDGTGATGTWGISITGNAATATTSAALTGITSNRFVIGNGTSSAYASSQMSYFNNVDLTVASTTVKRNGIHIWGQTYGNDATKLVSQTAGVMSWGDGGPQITFNSGSATPENGQAGALIFTDHDSCGTGASFHFVSNQTDWNVNSKRFVAKTSMTVGANVPNTSYNLSVTGTANISGATTGASFSASDYISANNSSGTAGGVNLYNRNNGMEYAIMFRQTSNQVKHGFVQSDWATYLTMGGNASNVGTRGWIFKDHVNSKGVASISGAGNMALNGELAIGTTGTDVSGSCSLVMDRNLSCLNFVFN